MDELQFIKRKIMLKKQGLILIAQEIRELQMELASLLFNQEYEAIVETDFEKLFSCRKLEDDICRHNHR